MPGNYAKSTESLLKVENNSDDSNDNDTAELQKHVLSYLPQTLGDITSSPLADGRYRL